MIKLKTKELQQALINLSKLGVVKGYELVGQTYHNFHEET